MVSAALLRWPRGGDCMCNIRIGCGKEEGVNSALVHNMMGLSGSCTLFLPSHSYVLLFGKHVFVSLLN